LTLVGVVGQERVRDARLAWRSRPLDELVPLGLIALGLVLGALSLLVYIADGYSHAMLWLWLTGLVIAAVGFGMRARAWPRIVLLDIGLAGGAVALCSPLYLIALYRWPVQVSSDEIAIMDAAQQSASTPHIDPFGASFYLTRPAMLFIVWGKLGNLIGGIDLFHMRLLHALVGLLTVAACYALFRVALLPRGWAVFAAVLVGASHSMFMISRLAMRENTSVLLLVVALTLLLWGLRNAHELATFLGGVVAGLGFYVYEPGRIAFPIWMVFLIGAALLYRQRFTGAWLLRAAAITTAGFLIVATPIVYSQAKVPGSQQTAQQSGLFIYKTAREEQKTWVFADSEWAGYVKNVKFGLGTFNNHVVDHSWIYPNYGHGFVDPLTGIVLWLGVGLTVFALVRRRAEPEALLMLAGFLVLWLSLAFLVNKAPNYTRLLVTLPFVAYLVTQAVRWLAGRWRSLRFGPQVVVGAFVIAFLAFNLSIAWDYIQQGRRTGEAIGSTGRYVDSHQSIPGERFYVVSSDASPYYVWGDVNASINRIEEFSGTKQPPGVVDPAALKDFQAPAPFALFMRREAWAGAAAELAARYPRGRIRNITPDGARVVLDVRSS
jgi:hypothetical protein